MEKALFFLETSYWKIIVCKIHAELMGSPNSIYNKKIFQTFSDYWQDFTVKIFIAQEYLSH